VALAAENEAALGRKLNIAFGTMVTVERLAEIICSLCGRPDLKPLYVEPRPGDIHVLQAETRHARELLGFSAEIDVQVGLKRYIDWFRARHPQPALLLEPETRNWEMPEEHEDAAHAAAS
jgi:nucleoside-diphosphate-sugar epimerase